MVNLSMLETKQRNILKNLSEEELEQYILYLTNNFYNSFKENDLKGHEFNINLLKDVVEHYKEKYPNILALLEDNEVENLNAEECKYRQKLLSLYSRMTDFEDIEIFFLGARENYYYFKNLELIKE